MSKQKANFSYLPFISSSHIRPLKTWLAIKIMDSLGFHVYIKSSSACRVVNGSGSSQTAGPNKNSIWWKLEYNYWEVNDFYLQLDSLNPIYGLTKSKGQSSLVTHFVHQMSQGGRERARESANLKTILWLQVTV